MRIEIIASIKKCNKEIVVEIDVHIFCSWRVNKYIP